MKAFFLCRTPTSVAYFFSYPHTLNKRSFGGSMKKPFSLTSIKYMLILTLFSCSFLFGRGAAFIASQAPTPLESAEKPCIVIDAGHGANDPGKVGINGVLEKDVNLAIVQKLAPLFENKGYRVILTRDSDDILADPNSHNKKREDMKNRSALIEQSNPLLTISIHQNSFPDPSVGGPQVFFYKTSEESRQLASLVQDHLDDTLCVSSSRGIKSNVSYYLLKKTPTPTIIVECGFLSNPAEAELLSDELYQEKLVRAIYLGAMEFLENSISTIKLF